MTWERVNAEREEPISVDLAQRRILSLVHPLPAHTVPLADAFGLALAADVRATVPIPPFRNSAMDGYAVRAVDCADLPATLRIIGQVAAGDWTEEDIGSGATIRIMTGAPVPNGTDAVIPFELVQAKADTLLVSSPVRPGANIRLVGEDIEAGAIVATVGEVVSAALAGALAAVGAAQVAVRRRPRVAILSTGDELVPPGTPLKPGKIWDANAPMLAGLVRLAGGEPHSLGIAADVADDIRSRLTRAGTPDLYITSGGVSAGDFDMVKDVLRADGSVSVCQVQMKPGRPLAIGTINEIPMIGLPGNPAAAYVSFLQFAWPAIRRLLGSARPSLDEIDAVLDAPVSDRQGRRTFVRGVLESRGGRMTVTPAVRQGSAMIRGLVESNCLIVIPEDREHLDAGDLVSVQLLPDAGLSHSQRRT